MEKSEPRTLAKPGKKASLSKKIFRFFKRIPGSGKDKFLLALVLIDLFFFMVENSFRAILSRDILLFFLGFDILVVVIWGVDLFRRFSRYEDKVNFFFTYWYEILGVLPFNFFRPFLLLRAIKIYLAYIKLFGKEKDIAKLNTKEITYKFRDMFIDTISDAVFLKSLDRVEEVMIRLDYAKLSKAIIERYEKELLEEFNRSMKTKEAAGAMARMPLFENFARQISEDYAKVFKEMLETEVMGKILKDFTTEIMSRMENQVKNLDVKRIVGEKESQ